MKRAMPWSDSEGDSSSDESLSESETDHGSSKSTEIKPKVKSGKKTTTTVDFDALKRYGYKGGPSVLSVPPPKEPEEQDWSWSSGKEKRDAKESEESFQERQKTRAALMQGEQLLGALTRQEKESLREKEREKKNVSFSQKEKRKRELGQASRGKNYVEEEKRLLRDSGIYSGFDS
ncbi:uncharacterized protein LOC115723431 [Cannabis sativa]|uniref:Uncharacterized protein n=2 Tax=Cannabis sativa TaxID=3483 RepID=A0AB40E864_CANSA|nr:uncharacterized protein LOC115723431 [Cannabis sativa]KAF4361390.1 hypothetical protein F8388_012850 [Cannabis sativa]KAF4371385.1 hypothetical protein G4B88_003855 [Cannabis sativa]